MRRRIACGWNALIWSSPDGTNWQNCSFNTIANLGPIVFQDGLYSIYSAETFMVSASAVVSQDGVHWVDASSTGPLLGIHEGILPKTLVLSLAGDWGNTYSLQFSTDLNQWSEMQNLTNSAGVTSLVITNLSNEAAVFFRATPN
jgi:hypothetical protein